MRLLSQDFLFSRRHSRHSGRDSASDRDGGLSFLQRQRGTPNRRFPGCAIFGKEYDPVYFSVRSILINSIGSGKMIVEFFSAEISVSVCR